MALNYSRYWKNNISKRVDINFFKEIVFTFIADSHHPIGVYAIRTSRYGCTHWSGPDYDIYIFDLQKSRKSTQTHVLASRVMAYNIIIYII